MTSRFGVYSGVILDADITLEKRAELDAFTGVAAETESRAIWADRRELSDVERMSANVEVNTFVARFICRSEDAIGINSKEWILKSATYDGGSQEEWDIQGIIQAPRAAYAEITAWLRK